MAINPYPAKAMSNRRPKERPGIGTPPSRQTNHSQLKCRLCWEHSSPESRDCKRLCLRRTLTRGKSGEGPSYALIGSLLPTETPIPESRPPPVDPLQNGLGLQNGLSTQICSAMVGLSDSIQSTNFRAEKSTTAKSIAYFRSSSIRSPGPRQNRFNVLSLPSSNV